MNTETKHTMFKIRLAPVGNTGKEMILLDCVQQLELGELFACTSAAEKRLLLEACNNYEQVKAQRDALLAACKVLASYDIDTCSHCGGTGKQHPDGVDACHHCGGTTETCPNMPMGQDIRAARAAIALCEKGGAQ